MLVEGSTVLTMDGRCADVSQLTMINVINERKEEKRYLHRSSLTPGPRAPSPFWCEEAAHQGYNSQ